MGFDPVSATVLGLASGGVGYLANKRACEAAEQSTEYQADLLRVQAENEKDALRTNLRRQKEDRDRYLSRVRLEQINSGAGMKGTNQLVFDEITSRLDERINDMTEAQLAQAGRTENAASMALYQGQQSKAASRLAGTSALIGGATQAFQNYRSVTQNTTPGKYKSVWSLFS